MFIVVIILILLINNVSYASRDYEKFSPNLFEHIVKNSSYICPHVKFYSNFSFADVQKHQPQTLSTLYCLLGSTEFKLDSNTFISHHFLIKKKYRQSLIYAFNCLKLNPFYESCWNILLTNYYHLKENEKFLFYQEFKELIFSNPSSTLSSSTLSSSTLSSSTLSTSTMLENYKKFKKLNLSRNPAFDIFETEYYILSQNSSLIIPSEIKRKCNLFSDQYFNYNNKTQSHFFNLSFKTTVKILNIMNESNGFEENIIGLSDWLKKFGISYKIVSTISKNDDNSIYIIFQFVKGLILPKRYIYWNYEKGPTIQLLETKNKKIGFQMKFEGTTTLMNKDEILFPLSFINGAIAIWESNFESLSYWRDIKYKLLELPLFIVPPLTPLIDIQEACQIKQTLSFKDNNNYNEIDVEKSEKPLDILFYGMYTPYRLELANKLRKKFYDNEWTSEIFITTTNINLYGSSREALINQANIVLNLNSYGPSDSALDFSLNLHRIRYLLGKGKVIISEKSGSIDESIYKNVVLFVDGMDDMINTIRKVLNNPDYRYDLEMKSIMFMTNDYTLLNSDENKNHLTFSLIGDGIDSVELFKKSTIQNLYNAVKFISQIENLNNIKSDDNSDDDSNNKNDDSIYHPIDMSNAELAISWASWQSFERHIDGSAFVYKSRSRYYDNILTSNYRENIINSNGIDKQLVIGYLQRRYQYKGRYLEIGCTITDNTILQMIEPKFSEKLCVDPYTNFSSYKMTSDDFFKNYKNLNFDLVFVDGLHEYNQGVRDVINALEQIPIDGTILVHDAYPRFEYEVEYPRKDTAFFWQGDIWKAVLEFKMMPNIDIALIDYDWGIVIIKKRPNPNILPFMNYTNMDWKEFIHFIEEYVPLLSFYELHLWLN